MLKRWSDETKYSCVGASPFLVIVVVELSSCEGKSLQPEVKIYISLGLLFTVFSLVNMVPEACSGVSGTYDYV